MVLSFLFKAAIDGYRLGKRCVVVRRALKAIFVTHLEIRLYVAPAKSSTRRVRSNEKK